MGVRELLCIIMGVLILRGFGGGNIVGLGYGGWYGGVVKISEGLYKIIVCPVRLKGE